jgi:hypothetical protein
LHFPLFTIIEIANYAVILVAVARDFHVPRSLEHKAAYDVFFNGFFLFLSVVAVTVFTGNHFYIPLSIFVNGSSESADGFLFLHREFAAHEGSMLFIELLRNINNDRFGFFKLIPRAFNLMIVVQAKNDVILVAGASDFHIIWSLEHEAANAVVFFIVIVIVIAREFYAFSVLTRQNCVLKEIV